MAKLNAYPPHKYFEIVDNQLLNVAIDLACDCAFWEDENYHYKQSQKTAQDEAGVIGSVLEEQRKQLTERG